jgi:hypothetical protein
MLSWSRNWPDLYAVDDFTNWTNLIMQYLKLCIISWNKCGLVYLDILECQHIKLWHATSFRRWDDRCPDDERLCVGALWIQRKGNSSETSQLLSYHTSIQNSPVDVMIVTRCLIKIFTVCLMHFLLYINIFIIYMIHVLVNFTQSYLHVFCVSLSVVWPTMADCEKNCANTTYIFNTTAKAFDPA